MPDQFKRDQYDKQIDAMETERSSFIPHYRSISEFMLPRRGRFEVSDRNKGDRRHEKIINGVATKALGVASAGMFNGTMSPSIPWLASQTPSDPDLMEFEPVRDWLYRLSQRMLYIFAATNLYTMAPIFFRESLAFGTSLMTRAADPENLSRFYTHTVGNYTIGQDDRQMVNQLGRDMEMTVEQVITKFSNSYRDINPNISPEVRRQYDKGDYHQWVRVRHLVVPNRDYRPSSPFSRDMRFKSVYWEPGHADKDKLLEEKGHRRFPGYAMRWELTDGDIYATNSPGITALGDVRQLQLEERRKAQGIEKMVSPIMQAPPGFKNTRWQNLPGFMHIYDAQGDAKGMRPAYEVKLPLGELSNDIKEVEFRIKEAMHNDLFKAITDMRGIQPRNILELTQRDQERLLELGPVLQRAYTEFLGLLFDDTFDDMAENDLLPQPIPRELSNQTITPKFTGILALAQQAAVTGKIERITAFAGQAMAVDPETADKYDGGVAFEEYAKAVGGPPRIVRDDREVEQRREQRRQQQQAAQNAQLGVAAADIAQKAAGSSLEGDNLLTRTADAINQQ